MDQNLYNYSWLYTCGFCCLYPLAFHFGIVWFAKWFSRIDWQNIRLPWRKEQ